MTAGEGSCTMEWRRACLWWSAKGPASSCDSDMRLGCWVLRCVLVSAAGGRWQCWGAASTGCSRSCGADGSETTALLVPRTKGGGSPVLRRGSGGLQWGGLIGGRLM
jgi:hypothetical protein